VLGGDESWVFLFGVWSDLSGCYHRGGELHILGGYWGKPNCGAVSPRIGGGQEAGLANRADSG